jgi:polyphenol oxidase
LQYPSFILRSCGESSWLEAPNLAAFPWIVHAFTSRAAGDFRGTSGGASSSVASQPGWDAESCFRPLLEGLRVPDFRFASARQVHSAAVVQVVREVEFLEYRPCGYPVQQGTPRSKPAADALITDVCGVLLVIRVADCLPVLIADAQHRVIAAVHAGWRGALEGIVGKTVREMRHGFDSVPGDLVVALGPCIRACCYAVGSEVVEAFCKRFVRGERFFRKHTLPGPTASALPTSALVPSTSDILSSRHSCLDLVSVALDQLESAGVPGSNVQVSELCTSCHTDMFYSHRKEGASTGRMIALIGVLEQCRIAS